MPRGADITLRLEADSNEKLDKEPLLKKVYEEIEIPLIPVLWQMEEYGIHVDVEKLKEQSFKIGKNCEY